MKSSTIPIMRGIARGLVFWAVLLPNSLVQAQAAPGKPARSETACPPLAEAERLMSAQEPERALRVVREGIAHYEGERRRDACLARMYVAVALAPFPRNNTGLIVLYVSQVMPAPHAYDVGSFSVTSQVGRPPRWGTPSLSRVLGDPSDHLNIAERLLVQAVTLFEEAGERAAAAAALANLGACRLGARRLDKAAETYRRLLALREASAGPGHSALVPALNMLALVHRESGDMRRAVQFSERALAIAETEVRKEVHAILATKYLLAMIYKRQKRYAQAEHLVAECVTSYPVDAKAGYPGFFEEIYNAHAEILDKVGRKQEARNQKRLAMEMLKKRPPDRVALPPIVVRQ